MKFLFLQPQALLAAALAAAFSLSPARSEAAVTGEALDGLNQSQLQEAFRVLSRHYIEHETLNYEQLNKAALDGLLRRLTFGVELVERNGGAPVPSAPFAFHEEIVAEKVAYLRPVTFDEGELSRSKEALRGFRQAKIETLILDLRVPIDLDEFARAAAFADYFTGQDELLFKIKKPGEDEARLFFSKSADIWEGRLILLVDRDTSSVAETVAAILQRECPKCITIGQRTLGQAVQYQEVALNESTALRFASAEVLLPDDTRIFRSGVVPDIASATPSVQKQRIFTQSATRGMAPFIADQDRPRMNEAALVAGTNPELEYYLRRSRGLPSQWDRRPLKDLALQTALESLIAIDFIKLPEEKSAPAPALKPKTPKAGPAAEKAAPDPEKP